MRLILRLITESLCSIVVRVLGWVSNSSFHEASQEIFFSADMMLYHYTLGGWMRLKIYLISTLSPQLVQLKGSQPDHPLPVWQKAQASWLTHEETDRLAPSAMAEAAGLLVASAGEGWVATEGRWPYMVGRHPPPIAMALFSGSKSVKELHPKNMESGF